MWWYYKNFDYTKSLGYVTDLSNTNMRVYGAWILNISRFMFKNI